jgi:hypothetical protein
MYTATAVVVVAIALVIWLCAGRVVYKGRAFAIHNNFPHISKDTRTVTVVCNKPVCGKDTLIATVSLEKAALLKTRTGASVTITVRRRFFGDPRVTKLTI